MKPACIVLCVTCGLSCQSTVSVAWPLLPPQLPPQVQVEWSNSQMEWNGQPMQVQLLSSPWSLPQLQHWLQQQAPQLQPLANQRHSHWQAWEQGRLTTASFAANPEGQAGSRAMLAMVDWNRSAEGAASYQQLLRDWSSRLPSGSRVRQLLRSHERGLDTVWLLAEHNAPAHPQWAALSSVWKSMGFAVDDRNASGTEHLPTTAPLFLQAGEQRLVISQVPQGHQGTVLLIQHTRPASHTRP